MAITKKSLIGNTSTNNSAKNKTAPAAATAATSPVTPGKMVPAIRLAKAQLLTTKAGLKTTRIVM
jgi:hypothetical protein